MPYTGAPQQGSPYTAAYGAPQQEAPKSSVDMGGAFKKAIDHIKNTVKKPITAAEEYYENGTIPFYKGDCIFVPADSVTLTIHGQAQFLDARG